MVKPPLPFERSPRMLGQLLPLFIVCGIFCYPFVVLYNIVRKFAPVNIPAICFTLSTLRLQLANLAFFCIISLKRISRFIAFTAMWQPCSIGYQYLSRRAAVSVVCSIINETCYRKYIRIVGCRFFGHT